MTTPSYAAAFTVGVLICTALASRASAQDRPPASGEQITLKGSMVCNGACVPNPKQEDHLMVLFAIDGTADVRAEVDRIVKHCYPDKGVDAEAAQQLLDQFSARLKFYIAPDSPALKENRNQGKNHYCQGAAARAVTGVVVGGCGRPTGHSSRVTRSR